MMDGIPPDLYTVEQFQIGLEAAQWPRYAESAQSNGRSPLDAVIRRIQKTMPEFSDIKVLQSGSTTAVVACDPVSGKVFVSFDPTKEYRPELFNFKFWRNSHPLGGAAHHGYSADLEYRNAAFGHDENGKNKSLVDSIEDSISNFADNFATPVTVTFSGFSKGGAQAVLASGEMIADGLFDNPDNIRLENVYAFAPPNYGTQKFVNQYNEAAEERGIKVWNISISTDTLSKTFSYLYSKVGNLFSMPPEDSVSKHDMTHSFNSYRRCLDRIKSALMIAKNIEEPAVNSEQAVSKLKI